MNLTGLPFFPDKGETIVASEGLVDDVRTACPGIPVQSTRRRAVTAQGSPRPVGVIMLGPLGTLADPDVRDTCLGWTLATRVLVWDDGTVTSDRLDGLVLLSPKDMEEGRGGPVTWCVSKAATDGERAAIITWLDEHGCNHSIYPSQRPIPMEPHQPLIDEKAALDEKILALEALIDEKAALDEKILALEDVINGSASDTVTFTVTATMQERWVPHFLGMLQMMEALGMDGVTRDLVFVSDGNGDFRPKFKWDTVQVPAPASSVDSRRMLFDAG